MASEFDTTIQNAMDRYYKLKMLDVITDRGFDYMANRRTNRLSEMERALNIRAKQRELGLPETSNDYERMTNDGPSFVDRLMPSMRKRALDAIPGPGFLPRKDHSIAQTIGDLLPSRKISYSFAKNLGGSRYGRAIGGLGRVFSL